MQDPSGGSFYVEKLTNDLSQNAWNNIKLIEKMGGITSLTSSEDFVVELRKSREKLKKDIEDKNIKKIYKRIRAYQKMIKFVYQNVPKGTGDAVLKTKRFIKDEYFLMLLPDDLIIKKNCSISMIKSHKIHNASVMASMSVNKKTVTRWGIFNLDKKLQFAAPFMQAHAFILRL